MRSDFEESATKDRDISGNMLQHISCSVKSLIIEVALIIYLNEIIIANNFKKWQRIVITNKCYSLSLCSKFLTTYFFNGLMANCGSQRERERERDCVKLSSRRGIGLKSIVAYPFVRKVLLLRLEIFSPLSSSKLLEYLFRTETGKIKFTSISCFNSFFENNNNRE